MRLVICDPKTARRKLLFLFLFDYLLLYFFIYFYAFSRHIYSNWLALFRNLHPDFFLTTRYNYLYCLFILQVTVNHTHKTCVLKYLYRADHDGNDKVQCGSELYNPYFINILFHSASLEEKCRCSRIINCFHFNTQI